MEAIRTELRLVAGGTKVKVSRAVSSPRKSTAEWILIQLVLKTAAEPGICPPGGNFMVLLNVLATLSPGEGNDLFRI